jgi:hypothetical protein
MRKTNSISVIIEGQNAFTAARAQIMQFARKIPVPAAIKRNLTKADIAFIAAAYAIPLPGTALFAAALVGSKHGCRHLRNRFKYGLILNASNG